MQLNPTDFIKLLKLPATYLLAISICTGFLLFANEATLLQLGLRSALDSFRSWIAGAFLLTTSLLLAVALKSLLRTLRAFVATLHGWTRLHLLTRREQDILQLFILDETRTVYFTPDDGDVCNLVRLNVLFRASGYGHQVMGLSYSIRSWAWWYLRRFPKLLGNSRLAQLKKRTY